MKRLKGRYATRENDVDNLLRAEIFVDLLAVVRHGIRVSVESYSIKKLEPLYSFTRSVALEDVGAVMARTQARLEMADSARHFRSGQGHDPRLQQGRLQFDGRP
jgi:predicted RecB family nuclease